MTPTRRLPPGRHCGIDFGTSNSTLGIADGAARLVALEGAATDLPTAVFYGTEHDTRFLIGRAAVAAYVEGHGGRLMRSLKSVLGTALIEETTQVHRRRVAFRDIVSAFVREVKTRAEHQLGQPLGKVVMGRPVHFVDDDTDADARAEATLAEVAHQVGFSEVSFQFEPVAAALAYEQEVGRETLALIADLGGGTADFTVVRLGPERRKAPDRAADLLANDGVRIGGTDYDQRLAMASVMPQFGFGSRMARGDIDVPGGPYWDLATWSQVNRLYDAKAISQIRSTRRDAAQPELVERLLHVIEARRGHGILMAVEAAKIALSADERAAIDLSWLEAGLAAEASRAGFEDATARLTRRLADTVRRCLKAAGLEAADVDALFFTGGTSAIPAVRSVIRGLVPQAAVVDGDRFGAVGTGLAVEAQRRYG